MIPSPPYVMPPAIPCYTINGLLEALEDHGVPWLIRAGVRVGAASLEVAGETWHPRGPLRSDPKHGPAVKRALEVVEECADIWPDDSRLPSWWEVATQLTEISCWWLAILAPDEWCNPFRDGKMEAFPGLSCRYLDGATVRSILGDLLGEARREGGGE